MCHTTDTTYYTLCTILRVSRWCHPTQDDAYICMASHSWRIWHPLLTVRRMAGRLRKQTRPGIEPATSKCVITYVETIWRPLIARSTTSTCVSKVNHNMDLNQKEPLRKGTRTHTRTTRLPLRACTHGDSRYLSVSHHGYHVSFRVCDTAHISLIPTNKRWCVRTYTIIILTYLTPVANRKANG